ncbi:kinase PINOID 2 [Spatholobus suberectus]|nr:kinase PINOID 2 [Spatholobus suberectus]
MSTASTTRDESSDNDSTCSSLTVADSTRSWLSTFSFRRRSSSSSSLSLCASKITTKAAWEAMQRLRLDTGGVSLDHFRLLRRLGSGDIGNVYLCQIRNPGVGLAQCLYAMKVVDREALAIKKKLHRAEMEKEILAMMDHPFLPTLYAVFDASHYSCFVMDFCPGGDLFSARQRQPGKRFTISSTKFYAAETLVALEYLHMRGIVYRDLKPENVLVREDGHIMLSDFDLCLKCDVVPKLLRSKTRSERSVRTRRSSAPSCAAPMQPVLSCFSTSSKRKKVTTTLTRENVEEYELDPEIVAEPINARSKSFVGTHEYLAPEVISGQGHGSAVDWWTFGVFLYEMLYGRTPFKGENNEKTLINILKQPLAFPRVAVSSSKEFEEMAKVQGLISKLLVKNPKKRIGCCMGSVEIKRHEFFKGVNWALIRSVRPPEVPADVNKIRSRVLLQKLSKKDKDQPFQITHHFDYF